MNLLPSWCTDNLFFPCLAVIHALSTLGKPFKCLMNQDSLVTTYTQGSGVDKTDTRFFLCIFVRCGYVLIHSYC